MTATDFVYFRLFRSPFWVAAGDNLIKIEADAFKETHVIYQALNSIGHHHDMLHTSELVDTLFQTFDQCAKHFS